ncbi:alpha-L-fucosidase [Flagellimonas okinawensis]|uniref:alpha-L-fucosidase n=1 Tax=Flagellimonas okinawensis TaxID=3031324 RepID=A0ABT5XTJ0_9FLAO|nr:alpha-L-fucosidase [[Muricauda] okinawensis]MDF0709213.1 alpha-L-fucosidase [[Muricauda] okinawensis]
MMRATEFWIIPMLLWAVTSCQHKKEVAEPEPLGPIPTKDQMAWHRMEMNAFVHFSINTFTDREWGYGDEPPELFDPSAFDSDQWMSVLEETGFKGVILTAKHHDGFALWPSAYTEHSIKNSPFRSGNGDVVRSVSESAARYGLKFGVYLSPWDRNHADYGNPSYIDYYRNQLRELFTGYGPIFEMWFDGANGGDGHYGGARERRTIDREHYYDWPNTLGMVDSIQPHVVFFSDAGPDLRWVGNERGVAGTTNWNTISPDTLYAGKAGIEDLLQKGTAGGSRWIPAEVDVSIRPGWFYHKDQDSLVKTPEELFQIYLTSVGRGSNLLLNVPPDTTGQFHAEDVMSLQGFKKILDSVFQHDLARSIQVSASTVRGGDREYSPLNLTDGDPATYWATDDGITSASLTLELDGETELGYLLLQEYIELGQRVEAFDILVWKQGQWKKVTGGTTIGYKRILPLDGVRTSKVKIEIKEALGCPLISNVEIY